jgi:hypothetical protein
MKRARRFALNARGQFTGSVLTLLYSAPWAWLVCFGAFVLSVTLATGRLPSYSHPDPKAVAGLCTLYVLTMVLLVTTAVSPLLVPAHMASRVWRGFDLRGQRGWLIAYAAGFSAAACVIVGDPLGLSSWLFD